MEGKPFFLGEICLNLTSSQKLANHYKKNIEESMQTFEKKFHPAILEDEELIRRAAFVVRNNAVLVANFYPQDHRVDVIVRDVSSLEVSYNIVDDTFHCPCPMHKPCRHIVAAVVDL